ncbi:MAG: phosphoenolpyruvate carboxykinase (ATP), partial [Eubacteriales bacterium]|nr:phosphoenolpyruvate carboxykinase (ATP) [Eubacteriales bacterium]
MSLDLSYLGIIESKAVYRNLPASRLTEFALKRGEGTLTNTGALLVNTGKYTGRSPDDRFVVDEPSIHNEIAWGKINVPISEEKFESIYRKMCAYLQNRELFVFDGFAGADPKYRLSVRVVNELASQNMFIHDLLIRPTTEELDSFQSEFTVIAAPGFKCIPEIDGVHSEAAIIISFERKLVIIAGSQYAGEIKKSVFSVMNYVLPKKGVFSMHCSANVGKDGDSAIFFGLSGTGKTTLSADPNRNLIGDDEHGWSDTGVFNIEGGCYAKCINLSKEHEPEIYGAIKFGALVENVIMDPETRELDFDDGSLTENTRVGYPVTYISNAQIPGVAGTPKTVIFLTADAFGVLPPVSKLSREAAMYHYVSGYTAKLAGTERGVTEPQATFSTCFGAPFLPLPASRYAQLLGEHIDKSGANVYLVNTGWTGGSYGKGGNRMKLPLTRAMVTACLNGELEKSEFVKDPIFNVMVPTTCPGVPSEVLSPKSTWADKAAYEETAKHLASM